jgi:hypothetical protein
MSSGSRGGLVVLFDTLASRLIDGEGSMAGARLHLECEAEAL